MAETALTIITEALRELRVLGRGETPEDDVANEVLAKLNDMLDSWSVDSIMCFAEQEENFPLVAGTSSYTIGPSGAFNTTRPNNIIQAWVRDSNGYDTDLAVYGTERWGAIRNKGQAGFASVLQYVRNYPLATIRLSNVPQEAATLYIVSDKPLTRFAALATPVSFPPGYKRALVSNLAVDRAASFGRKPSEELKEIAVATKEVIRRLNLPEVVSSYGGYGVQGGFNINTGGFA